MDQNRKRPHSVVSMKRVPLAETSANVPSPGLKKAKLKSVSSLRTSSRTELKDDAENVVEKKVVEKEKTEEKVALAASAASKSTRLVGDELKSWQSSWRKIMRESVVYFDTQGCDSSSQAQHQEQKRAQRALKSVGCEIVPFYDREVTIIVSRRPFSTSKAYPANDIFHDAVALKIKVWDYDKVFRFMKNLGVSESSTQERTGNLSNLLKEEKVFGSTDRDPNARRDDLYYLEKNFVYVYDLSQAVRPIVVREWQNDNYPTFHLSMDGKCPFIPDNSDNSERKKLRRLHKFEATKEYRELLKKASNAVTTCRGNFLGSTSSMAAGTSTDSPSKQENATTEGDGSCNDSCNGSHGNDTVIEGDQDSTLEQDDDILPYAFKPPIAFSRNSSTMQPFTNEASNSRFFDVAASGYNGASNAMSFAMDSALNSVANQGNGLGPAVSQVPSKNLNNLKRRIFIKRQLKSAEPREVELKPGYCENCRVKYEHFQDHIVSNRHRNFACNDENFKDIDDLIASLNESKSMGYVSSNGDYNVSF